MTDEKIRFDFEATNDPRKGVPYVARLSWDAEEKDVRREFFDLSRDYGKKSVTVSGTYEASPGEVIEVREGGSWKNDYRYWMLVLPDGEQVQVAYVQNSSEKTRVKKYLRGELAMEELLPRHVKTRLAGGRLRELEGRKRELEAELERINTELQKLEGGAA